ncbi:MAG: extracellular solute-binding protein [Lachnospiraceae bacterium]|nr:extracellular solute-binding protein [Lachnospiraceae bacterium]
MKNKTLKILALGMSIVMTMGLTACGATAPSTDQTDTSTGKASSAAKNDKVSIVLATNWGEGDAKYDYFYPEFEKFKESVADTIDITLETYTTEDYKTKIKTQTASGSLPDVFTYWGGGMMADMCDAGLLLNVDDYFKDSQTVKREDFEPGSFEFYVAGDGNTYGIPIESTRGILMANSELFKKYNLEYPKTYDDLLACAKVFNENGIIPMSMGSNGGSPSEFFFSELYNQYAGAEEELEALPAGGAFNTANAVKVGEVIQDMKNHQIFPEDTVTNGGYGPCLQLYTDQKAAMTYTYPWMFESIPENIQEMSDVIPMPQMPDSTVDSSTIETGFTVYGCLINKASYEDPAKHDAMVKVCDFIASDELNSSLVKSGMIPCKNVEVPYKDQKLIMQKTLDYSEGKDLVQVHYTKLPSASAISEMESGLDELFINAITPQEYVDKVQESITK